GHCTCPLSGVVPSADELEVPGLLAATTRARPLGVYPALRGAVGGEPLELGLPEPETVVHRHVDSDRQPVVGGARRRDLARTELVERLGLPVVGPVAVLDAQRRAELLRERLVELLPCLGRVAAQVLVLPLGPDPDLAQRVDRDPAV